MYRRYACPYGVLLESCLRLHKEALQSTTQAVRMPFSLNDLNRHILDITARPYAEQGCCYENTSHSLQIPGRTAEQGEDLNAESVSLWVRGSVVKGLDEAA